MTLHKPLWAQNETYSAMNDRCLIGAVFGDDGTVVNGLAVSQRGVGANMSVDVSAGAVVMPGPLRPYLGYSDAVENRTIGAAPAAGTSRRDLVYAEVTDPQAMGAGADVEWDIKVLAGTPAASAPSLPALPAWSTPLAEVLVEDDTVSVLDAAVTSRRPLAGVGARGLVARQQFSASSLDYAGQNTDFILTPYVSASRSYRIGLTSQVYFSLLSRWSVFATAQPQGGTEVSVDRLFYQTVSDEYDVIDGHVLWLPPTDGVYTVRIRQFKESGGGTVRYGANPFTSPVGEGAARRTFTVEDIGPR